MTGRYRLVESIGQGGMGRVWRAADEMLDRQVAVKEMRIDGLDAEDTRTRRERTLREARATARIDHPNVVRVYDVVDEGERLWIVMELVKGRSLERMMVEDGPLGPRAAALLGLGLVEALRQVHARGVLHRDIKPGNVLVESGDDRIGRRIVLTDFGIAAMQDAKALTMVGMLVGSPDYMAPERVSGRPQGPPSDIWSLGATLCAALGGRSPFSRDTTLATLHAVLYEEPELPAAAGPLTEVLAALLEKDPSIRPGLDEVQTALHEIAHPAPTPTLRVGPGEEPGERRGPGRAAESDGGGEEGAAGVAAAPDAGRSGESRDPRDPRGPGDSVSAGVPGVPGAAGASGTPDAPDVSVVPRDERAVPPGAVLEEWAVPPGDRSADPPEADASVDVSGGAARTGADEESPAPPWAPDESVTPAYLDTRTVRAVRDPRVPESETGPGAAVPQTTADADVEEPSDAVPEGYVFPDADADADVDVDVDVDVDADVDGEAEPEAARSDSDSVAAAQGTPAPTEHHASASTEAVSEERSEVRSEAPSGNSVGAVLRAGATTTSTPLASAPTQDSLSAGAPTEHYPMPDAPTRDTPTRAASAPTRIGPVRRPGISLIRGHQPVPDPATDPDHAADSGPPADPGVTAGPGMNAGSGVTAGSAPTAGPGTTAGPGVAAGPGGTAGSATTAAPGVTAGSAPTVGPGVAAGPGAIGGPAETGAPGTPEAPDGPTAPAPAPDPTPAVLLGPHPHRVPPEEAPAAPHRARRRTALVAAGSVVTAAAVVVVVILTTTSGSPGDDKAGGSPSASASVSEPGASTPGTPSSTVEGTSRPRSLPPGAHEEAGGFAWATPKGWRRDVKTGAEVHYTSPDGKQELAAKSSLARGDLMETWKTSEQNAHQGQDYRKIRLEETTFRDHPAVVWEYTFTLGGIPWHARLLGFNEGDKSYQINTWYQPDIESQALETYQEVKDSFTVL